MKQLRERGILRKEGTRYRLNDEFQDLNRLAREYIHHVHRQRAPAAMDAYTIIWEDHESFLIQTEQQVTDDSFLVTEPERFQEYGLPLLATEARYYLYPADQVDFSPEELPCHMLLIDSGSRHRRYCLLRLSSTDVDEEFLTSRATHYGVSELVDRLLDYLQSRGETTEDQLPSWDEFQEFAEEYELTV